MQSKEKEESYALCLDWHEKPLLRAAMEYSARVELDILAEANQKKPRNVAGIRACVSTLHVKVGILRKLYEVFEEPDEDGYRFPFVDPIQERRLRRRKEEHKAKTKQSYSD
ncbi:MAG: hypothetical protein J6B91_09455 [Prevotella sp.]|nr:hypothetical protein [Prevotella sp.]